MLETVTIPDRFVGPPTSGHGGYTAGLVAAALGDGPAEVTLRSPAPVGTPLQLRRTDGRVELRNGGVLVAEAVPADPTIETPDPVSPAAARRAAAAFDQQAYVDEHPFPTCFGCGPGRSAGDGLRLFPGLIGPQHVACPWIPHASLAAADGRIDPVYLWAALDCPSGLAWFHDVPQAPPHVLGRLTTTIRRRPQPGDELVVGGWHIAIDGRKRRSGAVIWDADGAVLAASLAVWISLEQAHHAQFRPTRT